MQTEPLAKEMLDGVVIEKRVLEEKLHETEAKINWLAALEMELRDRLQCIGT